MSDVIEVGGDAAFDIPATVTTPATTTGKNDTRQRRQQTTGGQPVAKEKVEETKSEIEIPDTTPSPSVPHASTAGATGTASLSSAQETTNGGQSRGTVARIGKGDAADGSPNLRHEYWMHKIETPNEDVMVEVVVNMSPHNPPDPTTASPPAEVDTTFAMSNKIGQATEIAKDPNNPSITPSVTVSRTGRSLFIGERGTVGGDSGEGGTGSGRLGRLTFPQPIVPESIKSFFWEGDLTIRAVLAVES